MSKVLSKEFFINGNPMYYPDREQAFSYEDIDSSDTGRTEDGIMHRRVVRSKVGKWEFKYGRITTAERNYMESLFPSDGTFQFTRPSEKDPNVLVTTECYRSKYNLSWFSSKHGIWKNYSFNIIEC